MDFPFWRDGIEKRGSKNYSMTTAKIFTKILE